MKIPEYILKRYGDTPEKIIAQKTEGNQQREATTAPPSSVKLSPDECRNLCKARGIDYQPGYEERVLSYTCSDESVDRYGDIIRQEGWDLKNFQKNPVVMGFHNYGTFPVGNSLKEWVDGSPQKDANGKSGAKLKMWVLFADKAVNEDADKAFRMAKSGFMKAGSVGFLPKTVNNPTKDEREALGMTPWGVEYQSQELLEHTVCGVPANANALQEAVSKGIIEKKELKGWYKDAELEVLKEENLEQKFTGDTGTSDGHTHPYNVDEAGNGSASKGDTNHTHSVEEWKVSESEGHSHTITKPEGASVDSADNGDKMLSFTAKQASDLIKELIDKRVDELVDQKAGAVLSKKNKELVMNAADAMKNAIKALDDLLANADKITPEDELEKHADPDADLLDFDDEDEPTESEDMYALESFFKDATQEVKTI